MANHLVTSHLHIVAGEPRYFLTCTGGAHRHEWSVDAEWKLAVELLSLHLEGRSRG